MVPYCALGLRVLDFVAFSGSAGKNRKPPSATRFFPTKPQVAEGQNWGLVPRSRFFSALPNAPAGSMRQILESPSTPPFSGKEATGRSVAAIQCVRHVWNLPHISGFSTSSTGLFID